MLKANHVPLSSTLAPLQSGLGARRDEALRQTGDPISAVQKGSDLGRNQLVVDDIAGLPFSSWPTATELQLADSLRV